MFRNTEYGSGYTCRSHAPRSKSSPPIKSSCGACRCRHRHYTNDKHVAQYCGTRSRLLPSGTIASEYRTGIDRLWELFALELNTSHVDRFSMPEYERRSCSIMQNHIRKVLDNDFLRPIRSSRFEGVPQKCRRAQPASNIILWEIRLWKSGIRGARDNDNGNTIPKQGLVSL